MGMFDKIHLNCIKCGESVEFQSKSGPCEFDNFKEVNVRAEVLVGINGKIEVCKKCEYPNKAYVTMNAYVLLA